MDIAITYNYDQELALVQACINNERWAQQQLYQENYGKLMAICLRYAGNEEDAMDILHEGFIKIFKNIHRYQSGTSLFAWMRRIMVNAAIDFYRKAIRRRVESIEQAQQISSSDADAISQFSEKEIMAAIQQLSPAYRTVFNLNVIEGYTHKEIGEMLEITESTSRSNLVKARLKLRDILLSSDKNSH